jgi:hypothetical protein
VVHRVVVDPPAGGGRLTIEHPFGRVLVKEVRVTKHDAARKQKIIDFIAATLRARGYPPSVREIAMAVGLASTVRRPSPPVRRWNARATSSVARPSHVRSVSRPPPHSTPASPVS